MEGNNAGLARFATEKHAGLAKGRIWPLFHTLTQTVKNRYKNKKAIQNILFFKKIILIT